MTKMQDPIERLRDYAAECCPEYEQYDSHMMRLADEIEAAYMKLPVGADGVPIRVGDMLKGVYSTFEVCAVSDCYVYWAEGRRWDNATLCRHAKPVTVESLLDEFDREMMDVRANTLDDDLVDAEDKVVADYAERIREAVER